MLPCLRRGPGPRALALLALATLTAALACADSARAAHRPFATDSVWNRPLTSAPPPSSSPGLVRELVRQVGAYGAWINTHQYSTPVYKVPYEQPRVRVILDKSHAPLQADFESVPLPPTARPATGSDGHLVLQASGTNTMWEFWRLQKRADGWHAAWGGKMREVSANPGYFANPYGATATSLPLLGGLMRIEEVRAGAIDHALALGLPEVRSGIFSWPAQRTDGTTLSTHAIPAGTRFRLDPALNIASLGLPPATAMIARAAQRYGIVVRDRAGVVTLFGEDPTPSGTNPWPALWGTRYPNQLLERFPWSRLQVVPPSA